MSKQPNIIVFFSDQQRWDTIGAYGQPLPVTPNLDRMAEEGVIFQNTFSCQPVCGPARAAIQTGRYPTEVNCPTNNCLLPLDAITLPKILGDAGYETAYIGKWHLASCGPRNGPDSFRTRPVPMERRGGYRDFWLASDTLEFTSHSYDGHMFDTDNGKRDFPEGRFRADAQTDWVIEYLESRSQEKPLFLFISYIEPHHQNDHGCYEGPAGSKERWKDFVVPGDLEGTQGNWRENYPDYLGCCHSLDENVGRLRATLDKLGMSDDTVLLYTSDHGSHFCTRNGEYKRSCHDASIHIPMIACGPGFPAGESVDAISSLIDLPTTVLRAGGVEAPAEMRGRALQDAVGDVPEDWPEDAFLQISEDHCGRALRTHRWTYEIVDPDADRKGLHGSRFVESVLYDNDADPHQKNNLVSDPDYADVRAKLRERIVDRMRSVGEPEPTIQPA